jgi:molecular chaperone DnaJ
MTEKRDYYDVLGVPRDASPDDIRRAYKRLARKHHPDVNHADPQAEERFKELGEAYGVISDPEKRATYDRFGHNAPSGGGGYAGGSPFGDINDIFGAFFGDAGGQRHDPTGDDLRYGVEVSLNEAATGVEKSIRLPHQMPCTTCHGRGSETGTPSRCPGCAGTGQRRQMSSALFMQFTTVVTCERCAGSGEIILDPCTTCGGSGRARGVEEFSVNIPAGVETGMRMTVRGKGDAGLRGARPGDLYLDINVRPHPIFKRRHADLVCEVDLPYATAALGGHLLVPTLNEQVDVDIPAGTQAGQAVRVRGKGMPRLNNGGHGDLYAVMKIAVPTDLSPRQKELLREYATERGQGDELKARSGFEKVKDAIVNAAGELRDILEGK